MAEIYFVTLNELGTAITCGGYSPDGTLPPGAIVCSKAISQNPKGYTAVNGVLIAPAAPTAAQILATAQANQVSILSGACAAQIVGGQQSSALGAPHTYPSNLTVQHPDQQNLASSVLSAVMASLGSAAWVPNTVYAAGAIVLGNGIPMTAQAGGTSGAEAPAWPTQVDTIVDDNGVQWEMWATPFWCEDGSGNWAWIDHSAAQIQQVGNDVKGAVLACQAQNAMLAAKVNAITPATPNAIAAVQAITWPA
jgi:hypothetical protein